MHTCLRLTVFNALTPYTTYRACHVMWIRQAAAALEVYRPNHHANARPAQRLLCVFKLRQFFAKCTFRLTPSHTGSREWSDFTL